MPDKRIIEKARDKFWRGECRRVGDDYYAVVGMTRVSFRSISDQLDPQTVTEIEAKFNEVEALEDLRVRKELEDFRRRQNEPMFLWSTESKFEGR